MVRVKEQESLSFILGIQVQQDKYSIKLRQMAYLDRKIDEFGMKNAKNVRVLVAPVSDLLKISNQLLFAILVLTNVQMTCFTVYKVPQFFQAWT